MPKKVSHAKQMKKALREASVELKVACTCIQHASEVVGEWFPGEVAILDSLREGLAAKILDFEDQ